MNKFLYLNFLMMKESKLIKKLHILLFYQYYHVGTQQKLLNF